MSPIHAPTPLATLAGLIIKSPNDVYKLVASGSRSKVVDKHTLPILLQQVMAQNKRSSKLPAGGKAVPSWRLGLEVVRAPSVSSLAIRLDEGIWATLHKECPCEQSKQACSKVLTALYERSNRRQD